MSLQRRLILAASVVLAAFLGLTGAALDRAFREASLQLFQERLLTQVYALLGAAEVDPQGRLILPENLPDPRLATPASGLYAQVRSDTGTLLWRSRSTVGTEIRLAPPASPGVPAFAPVRSAAGAPLFGLAYAVRWEVRPGEERDYRIEIAETRAPFDAQLWRYRRNLWGWLAGAALLLLGAQGLILRWGLAPLGRLAREIGDVEAERRETVSENWPAEIRPLAANLNALIRTGRGLIERHRNALGDLAHSLKTPLAVLRSELGHGTADEQIERMNRTVEYHLRRASASGAGMLARRVDIEPIALRVRDALLKVHAEKSLAIEVAVSAGCHFHGDEGDLTEIFGNLLDNACKWARGRVRVTAHNEPGAGRRADLCLEVEDDGPGIPAADAARILERGARADQSVPGQGIGLAVVRELACEAYAGSVEIDRADLGGARVRVRLTQPD